jgi:hypothetical protein
MNSNKYLFPDWESQYDSFIEAGTAKATRRAYTRDVKYFREAINEKKSNHVMAVLSGSTI